jgi:hypothetical protein
MCVIDLAPFLELPRPAFLPEAGWICPPSPLTRASATRAEGAEVIGTSTPSGAYVTVENAKWREVIRSRDVRVQ